MKNQFKPFGLAVLVTAIVFSFAACKNDTTDPLTDPALNGTWKRSDGVTWKFNNGTYENLTPDPFEKGTFTTSGSSMTQTPTHFWGTTLSLSAKWYTKAELIAAGKSEALVNSYFDPWTLTYSVSGSTLTLDGNTYTKQ